MALTTKTIINDGQFLVVTSSSGNVESINLAVIKNITYTYVASPPGTYSYTDMCLLTVEFADREADLSFDLASVTNQVGWTLNQAGCIQAEADIRGWATSAGGGGGDATEATLIQVKTSVIDQGIVPQATETTQLLVKANTDKLDVNLSTRATEGTASSINSELSTLNTNQVGVLNAVEEIKLSTDLTTPDIDAIRVATEASSPKANTLVSSSTTGAGTIPLGSKAASIFIDGIGATINLVERPDGWSQSFEFNNNTLPAISYDGMGTATVYVDILT
jgi:hypothetical protein